MKGMHGKFIRQQGMTYVEALLAVLLISVCLVPVMQSIHDNFGQQSQMSKITGARRDNGCAREAMERVMSEPYSNLLAAATSTHSEGVFSNPTSYSMPPTEPCPIQRNVFILRYLPPPVQFSSTSNDMLYVRIEQAGTAPLATLAITP